MKLKVGDRVLVKLTLASNPVLEGRIIEWNEFIFKGWMVQVKEWGMVGKFAEKAIVPIPEYASPVQVRAMQTLFK